MIMGQLRTANKRRNRAIRTLQAEGKAIDSKRPAPIEPRAEGSRS